MIVAYTGKSHDELVSEGKSSTGAAYGAAHGSASSSSADTGSGSTTAKSYSAGTHKIGADMPAGEYKLTATSSLGGYWKVTESSPPDADIVGNDNFDGSTYVTVSEGQYLKFDRCKAEAV